MIRSELCICDTTSFGINVQPICGYLVTNEATSYSAYFKVLALYTPTEACNVLLLATFRADCCLLASREFKATKIDDLHSYVDKNNST